MKIKFLLSAVLLWSGTFQSENYDSFFSNFTREGKIIKASVADLTSLRNHFDYVLVYYSSATCQSCLNFREKFFEAAEELTAIKPDLPIVEIKCSDSKFSDFCTIREKVQHLPTFRIYHHD